MKCLHFAPEGSLGRLFKSVFGKNYIRSDFSQKRDGLLQLDITNTELQDNYCDIIFASHVLEHVLDDNKALNECYRILRNGGKAIFMIPQDFKRENTYEDSSITDPVERKKHFGQEDHCRWYGLDFPNRVKNAGFSKISAYYTHNFKYELKHVDYQEIITTEELYVNHILNSSDIIYICEKS